MKKLPLLPHACQRIGLLALVPFLALGIAHMGWDYTLPWLVYHSDVKGSMNFSNNNLTDELAAVGIIFSLVLIAFSKEKIEDEAIQFFRLASLQWAVIVNYVVLVICILSLYGGVFFTVMTINMFTILFFFIIRFRYVLFQHNKADA